MDTKWLTELGKKLSAPRSQGGSYNIFQVLKIEDKEVLICRFLGDLLNATYFFIFRPSFLMLV